MIDIRTKNQQPVEWFTIDPNFESTVWMRRRHDGVIVDSWPDGSNYWLLVMDLQGKLHRLAHHEVTVIEMQTHINRRNHAT